MNKYKFVAVVRDMARVQRNPADSDSGATPKASDGLATACRKGVPYTSMEQTRR